MAHRFGNVAVVGCAVGIALLAIQHWTHALPGSPKTFVQDRERCYGVVRAGKNDCGTAKHACAAQAKRDGDPAEWLMLPAGTCVKIAGGGNRSPEAKEDGAG